MLDLYNPNFYLLFEDLVPVRVFAINAIGTSTASTQNNIGATVKNIPAKMIIPFKGPLTSDDKIQVQWLAMTTTLQTGDSTILSYELMWDNGTGFVYMTAQDALSTSALLVGLNSG